MSIIVALLLSFAASNSNPPVNIQSDSLALRGYDAVSYFTDGQAVRGRSAFEITWNGARWRFVSAAHRDEFMRAPDRYAPQFGGYCAWAVAHNYTADGDPEAWKIVGGKLYLNYSKRVQKKWEADIPTFIKQGEKNWPGVLSK